MSVKLTISVPDVNQQMTDGFDFIRVFRSTTGASGPFAEITAVSPAPATVVGSIVGPFSGVAGTSLLLRANRGPTQTVLIPGTDPLSATQIADAINAQVAGFLSEDDGTGRLKISTTGTGTDEIIEVLGEVDPLMVLGFSVGQFDIGEASRVPLVEDITEYLFEDVAGSSDDFYEIDFINSATLATSTKSDPVQGALVETIAKQQADTRAPKGLTLIRKSTHVFRNAFFSDPDCLVPLVPLDASKYPSFQIVDINGQIVAAGLATLDGTPGNYRVEFFVPADAPISNDDRRWRIEWLFIDEDNRQLEKTTEFDVRDVDITATPVRDLKLIAMERKPFRVHIREVSRPYSIRLDVAAANNATDIIAEDVLFPGSGSSGEVLLTEAVDNETYVYYYDIPEDLLLGNRTYLATWSISGSITASPQYAFQVIEVPPRVVLQFFPSLRMCIDKFQKQREHIQAYQDSDIYEYLIQGLRFINSWHPLTGYSLTDLPEPLIPFWLMAGQLWGLNAQHLLETDLQFSFGGQTVTLDYDHTGNIEAGISRALDFLRDNLTSAKMPLFRRAAGVGVMAGKTYRLSGRGNFTYKLASFGSNDYMTLLNRVGLL